MMAAPSLAAHRPSPSRLSLRLDLAGDDRLARLVARGSERAFTSIYGRYHQRLYRYCWSIVRSDADAQDVLQSTFSSAFVALQQGRRDAPLRPWLFRIAHNEAISLLRRRARFDDVADVPDALAPSVEARADARERLATLVADLRELPDRQRSALLMRELSGLSHEEIALALGTSAAGAKQSIFEARSALADVHEGRAMACEDVRRVISDRDRRALRGRRVRAHLRDCSACAAFAAAIPSRRGDLHALAPVLAPAAAAELLGRCGAGGASHGAHAAVVAGAGAGKPVAAALSIKSLLVVGVLATGVAGTVGLRAVVNGRSHDRATPAAARHGARVPGRVAPRTAPTATRAAGASGAKITAPAASGVRRADGAAPASPASGVAGALGRSRSGGQAGQTHGTSRSAMHGRPGAPAGSRRRAGAREHPARRSAGRAQPRSPGAPPRAKTTHGRTGGQPPQAPGTGSGSAPGAPAGNGQPPSVHEPRSGAPTTPSAAAAPPTPELPAGASVHTR